VLVASFVEFVLGHARPLDGASQRLGRIGTVQAYVVTEVAVDRCQSLRCCRIRSSGGGGALQMLLQQLGIVDHAEQLGLPHAGGDRERAPVQAQPHRTVRGSLEHDLVGVVTSERDVFGGAVDVAVEVVA
jgi:hypothetical protein